MINLTIAQFSPEVGNKEKNLTKMINMIKEAKQQRSEFVLFPELALTGYITSDEVYTLGETIEGPSIKKFREVCKKESIHAAISFIEKDEGDHHYISCALVDDEGEIIGVYRKTHQFDEEVNVYKPGDHISVFETKLGKIGVMICYDLEFPEIARTLKKKGAEIIIVPLANMKPYEQYQAIYTRSRAMENEVPIAICNQSEQSEGIEFFGQSCAVDLYGNTLVQLGNNEGMATTKIDLNIKNDSRLDYINRLRPEIYKLD